MGISIDEMYKDLLDMENIGSFLGEKHGSDEDSEVFMTSKEMVKAQKEAEEQFGITPATKVEVDEQVHFKSYSKKRVHKYTESELAAIRESCENTIVHDYGDNDIFHMSDEEREKIDMLAELSMKLGTLKRTYRRVDQYIEAMRIVVQGWKILEQRGNYIHEPDEFFAMVGDEKIVSSRIVMPKLKRMSDYNIDQIIKYISNPELDPADLLHDPTTTGTYDPENDFIEDRPDYIEYYNEYMNNVSDEEKEEKDEYDIRQDANRYAIEKIEEEDAMRLLSEEEAEYLLHRMEDPPSVDVKPINRKFIKGYDTTNILRKSGKSKRKMNKSERTIQKDIHDLLLKLQNNPANRNIDDYNRSYLITNGMFDTDKPERDFWEDLYFDGSWANDTDVYLYNLAVREEFLRLHPPKERYLTYGDKALNAFFQAAERNGINVIELRRRMEMDDDTGVLNSAVVRERTKENKKLEAVIVHRLTQLNNNPKFKKLVEKSEKALNRFYEKQ